MRPQTLACPRRFAVVALIAVLALAAWLTGLSTADRVRFRADSAAATFLVRVTAPQTADAVPAATLRLRSLPEVIAAGPLSRDRVKALLESAGGDTVDGSMLPPLRLIEVRVARGPDSDVRIGRALRAAGFDAEIFATQPDLNRLHGQATSILLLSALAALAGALVTALLTASIALRHPHNALAVEIGVPKAAHLAALGRAGADLGFRAGLIASLACAVGAPLVLAAMGEPISRDRLFMDAPALLTPTQAALGLLAPLLLSALCALAARAGARIAYNRADLQG